MLTKCKLILGCFLSITAITACIPSPPPPELPQTQAAETQVAPTASPVMATTTPEPVPGTEGRSWVTIMCKFRDVPDEPKQGSYFESLFSPNYPGIPDYYRTVTYGNISIRPYPTSYASGWYTLPKTARTYVDEFVLYLALMSLGGNLPLVGDCLDQADPFIDFSKVWGINVALNKGMPEGGGVGYRWIGELDGVSRTWPVTILLPACWSNMRCVVHEMLHTDGLLHSLGGMDIIQNPWDVMSPLDYELGGILHYCEFTRDPQFGCLPQVPMSFHLFQQGWLPRKSVVVLRDDGVSQHRVFTLLPPPSEGTQMLAIPRDDGCAYTVEARAPVSYDINLPTGITVMVLHLVCQEGEQILAIGNDPTNSTAPDPIYIWTTGDVFWDEENHISICVGERQSYAIEVTVKKGGETKGCEDD